MVVSTAKKWIRKLLGPRFFLRRLVARELRVGEPELRLLPALCDRSKAFLDVGANRGVYSFEAEKYAKKVYAVEAFPPLVQHLRAVLSRSTEIFPVALSDEVGEARLSVPQRSGSDVDTRCSLQADANPGFDSREIAVSKTTIDQLGLTDLGLIKIDVEGHEYPVVAGARRTLLETRPTVVVECEERHNVGGVERLFQFFRSVDYQPYFLNRGALKPGSDFDVGRYQTRSDSQRISGDDRPIDYVNNFIFVPSERADVVARLTRAVGR